MVDRTAADSQRSELPDVHEAVLGARYLPQASPTVALDL